MVKLRTSVAILGLLFVVLVSPAASQPPTVAEQPLVIEGRVLWIDFGSETLALAPVTGGPAIAIDLHLTAAAIAIGSCASGRGILHATPR